MAQQLKNSLLVGILDPDTLITNHENYLLSWLVIGNKHLDDPLISVLNCVLDQVDSHLLKSIWISDHLSGQNVAGVIEIIYKLMHFFLITETDIFGKDVPH